MCLRAPVSVDILQARKMCMINSIHTAPTRKCAFVKMITFIAIVTAIKIKATNRFGFAFILPDLHSVGYHFIKINHKFNNEMVISHEQTTSVVIKLF